MMKETPLAGKVALVTGGGRGIGKATAELLAEAGASVILTARTETQIKATADAIKERGGEARAIPGDITEEPFVVQLFETVKEEYGRLDILINNAGMAPFGRIEDLPVEKFRACLELNILAVFMCTQQAVRIMKANGDQGKIVNIGSVRSHWSENGGDGAYNASKYGLRGFTETVARQLHGSGSKIALSLVCPGGVDTSLVNPSGEPRPNLLRPRQVAESVLHIVTAPPEYNVYDVTLFSMTQKPW